MRMKTLSARKKRVRPCHSNRTANNGANILVIMYAVRMMNVNGLPALRSHGVNAQTGQSLQDKGGILIQQL